MSTLASTAGAWARGAGRAVQGRAGSGEPAGVRGAGGESRVGRGRRRSAQCGGAAVRGFASEDRGEGPGGRPSQWRPGPAQGPGPAQPGPRSGPAWDEDLHLEGLNAEQFFAVTSQVGSPQRVLAGPGSGKTRVLTSRVAHLVLEGGVEARSVMCLTFTNKAALEMRERLARVLGAERASGVRAGTFHRVCCHLLRTYLPVGRVQSEGKRTALRSRDFTIYDTQDSERVVGEVLKELVETGKEEGGVKGLDGEVLRSAGIVSKGSVRAYISGRKSKMVTAAMARKAAAEMDKRKYSHKWIVEQKLNAYLYGRYQAELDEADALDFDDLLWEALKMLKGDPALLAQVRSRYRHVLVDEFQDTNATQYEIAQLLAEESRSLFVVGDTDQSIYGWRGAITAANMKRLLADFPETETHVLASNYRSTPEILTFAKRLLAGGGGDRAQQGMSSIGAMLMSQRDSGLKVEVEDYQTSVMEAHATAAEILNLRADGTALKDIAVLYRTHQQTVPVESALREHGIPYVVVGGTSFFGRMEVKDLLSFLRLIWRPDDSMALDRIYNVPKRGLGDVAYARLKAWAAEQGAGGLASALARLPLTGDGSGVSEGLLPAEITPRARSALAQLLEDLGACRSELERGGTVSGTLEAVIERTGYYAHVEKLEERDVKSQKKVAKAGEETDMRKRNIEELLEIARRHDAEMAAKAVVAASKGEGEGEGEGEVDGEGAALSGVASLGVFLEATVLNEQLSVLEVEGADDEVLTSEQVKAQDKVRLMTLHASKGLEFAAVFLIGVEEGRLPLASNTDVEEERRLAYVGVTRAKDRLYVSHARETSQYGEYKRMSRSSFLDDLLGDGDDRGSVPRDASAASDAFPRPPQPRPRPRGRH